MSNVQPQKKTGLLGNLAFNIIIPVLILTNLSSDEYLGPAWSIVAALIFPIGFGIWDLKQTAKINPFSLLGIVSVLLTGVISLLELPAEYIAIKEATIPAIIGIAVLITQRTSKPLLKVFVLSEQIINWKNLNQSLANSGTSELFEKKMAISSYIELIAIFFSKSSLVPEFAKD